MIPKPYEWRKFQSQLCSSCIVASILDTMGGWNWNVFSVFLFISPFLQLLWLFRLLMHACTNYIPNFILNLENLIKLKLQFLPNQPIDWILPTNNLLCCSTGDAIKNDLQNERIISHQYFIYPGATIYILLPAILFLKYINRTVSSPRTFSDPSVFKGRTWNHTSCALVKIMY